VRGPRFDTAVPAGGYVWWYLDALSEDGKHGLTLIAFVGSVFSPYYAWARQRGDPNPLAHCAVNVALYGAGGHRWAMTERGHASVVRERDTLAIGPSSLRWERDALVVRLDELTAPLPTRIRGEVRLHPHVLTSHRVPLDERGGHAWWPVAPLATVEVDLERPGLRWRGAGYCDSNAGDAPLESAFSRWEWSRSTVGEETTVLYEVERRSAARLSLALGIDRTGVLTHLERPAEVVLPTSRWGIARATRSEAGARVLKTLEDGPFYARSLVETRLRGATATAIHESLSLDRFRQPWVRWLLPFRMPRRGG
jgi:carotenoid 1,2-hydratase